MRTRAIRVVVIIVCAAGIAGMIVTSATNHNGAAITFGIITAVAILCQMVATTVTDEQRGAPGAPVTGWSRTPERTPDDRDAEELEDRISGLVGAGADEEAVRDLVRQAVRLGGRLGGNPRRQTPASAQSPDS